MDREKVIAWLADEELYYREHGDMHNSLMACDALALLEEQEAKMGHWVSVNDGDKMDIKKVTKGLEFCIAGDKDHSCGDCLYKPNEYCIRDLMSDALELLNQQNKDRLEIAHEIVSGYDGCVDLLVEEDMRRQ